ncbi:MAG: response regulator transcription factor [Chloroflexi bacterium]|nr:response regulator transcription factor [Chloroflexota bacterium]
MTLRPRQAPEQAHARVLVADPEMLVRAGLRAVIDADRGLRLVAEAETGPHAIELGTRLKPHLAVVSTGFHEPSWLEVVAGLRAVSPATVIVLLARAEHSRSIVEGFRAGVTGFVRSDIGRLELLAAIHRALAGESVVDPVAATELIMRMASESELSPRSRPDPLTPREVEILQLVAQGQTNREIASRLIVAVGTIKIHVEHILGKLGAADRTQAAVRAVELGIVSSEEPAEARPHPH